MRDPTLINFKGRDESMAKEVPTRPICFFIGDLDPCNPSVSGVLEVGWVDP
ncbi:hypothetical protein GCM10009603_25450 [Nocardiopsis exhalans]